VSARCGTSPGRRQRCCGICIPGVQRAPLLAWLAADYPDLFSAPDLDKRLWLYALAYTIRHIIFWPPDRPKAGGLDVSHPLHTLRRLVDAPLPL